MVDERALGAFLRSRRERLHPSDVGLPDSGRRRTPGLRREEVAALAGVSIDYLVRLEQGRDRNPSASVVTALANALQLDGDERLHLKKLAQCESNVELCPFAESDASDGVAETTRAVIERLDPTPAVVVGPWYQVLAHNEAWDRIMRPVGVLDRVPPNLRPSRSSTRGHVRPTPTGRRSPTSRLRSSVTRPCGGVRTSG